MARVHVDRSSHHLEQIWAIATCGALGVVMILLWWYKVLAIFLDAKFHDSVLWGGMALLALVAVRLTGLWRAGQTVAGHSHGQAEGNGQGQGCQHHDHEHQHDHGFAPWRYAVLLVPILLFLIRVPWPEPEEPVEDNVIAMKLGEAEGSAESPDAREHWKKEMESKSVRLKAKFGVPVRGDRMFGLAKINMTCCRADAYATPVRIIVESPRPLVFDNMKDRWLKVIGKLDYRKTGDSDRYVTVVKAESIKVISTPANQFDN
jgi:hypothetical protein